MLFLLNNQPNNEKAFSKDSRRKRPRLSSTG